MVVLSVCCHVSAAVLSYPPSRRVQEVRGDASGPKVVYAVCGNFHCTSSCFVTGTVLLYLVDSGYFFCYVTENRVHI